MTSRVYEDRCLFFYDNDWKCPSKILYFRNWSGELKEVFRFNCFENQVLHSIHLTVLQNTCAFYILWLFQNFLTSDNMENVDIVYGLYRQSIHTDISIATKCYKLWYSVVCCLVFLFIISAIRMRIWYTVYQIPDCSFW